MNIIHTILIPVLSFGCAFACIAKPSDQTATSATTATASEPSTASDTTVNPDYKKKPANLPDAKPDKGLVIIYRKKEFYGALQSIKIFIDGAKIEKIKNGNVVYTYLEPGDRILYSDKKKRRDARILGVEAGKTYYFRASFSPSMTRVTIDLLPIDEALAVSQIQALNIKTTGK
jgi:Protein of unknown function (DUF2846)